MELSDVIHPESPAYLELMRIAAEPDSPHKIMRLLHVAERYIDLGCYSVGERLLEDVVAIYEALKKRDDYQEQFLQHASMKKGPPFSPASILRNFIRIGKPHEAYSIYLRWWVSKSDGDRLSQQQFLKVYR